MMLRMLTTTDTYIGYFALLALLSDAESESDMAWKKAKPPTILIYGSPYTIRSGLSPIIFRKLPAKKYRHTLMTSPERRLKRSEIPTVWITLSLLLAPMYWEHRMDGVFRCRTEFGNLRICCKGSIWKTSVGIVAIL